MLSGYVSFDRSKVHGVPACSGKNGIFFNMLRIPFFPEVERLTRGEIKGTPRDYLELALAAAMQNKTHLTYRRGGGGACLGIIHHELIDECRHWACMG